MISQQQKYLLAAALFVKVWENLFFSLSNPSWIHVKPPSAKSDDLILVALNMKDIPLIFLLLRIRTDVESMRKIMIQLKCGSVFLEYIGILKVQKRNFLWFHFPKTDEQIRHYCSYLFRVAPVQGYPASAMWWRGSPWTIHQSITGPCNPYTYIHT